MCIRKVMLFRDVLVASKFIYENVSKGWSLRNLDFRIILVQ